MFFNKDAYCDSFNGSKDQMDKVYSEIAAMENVLNDQELLTVRIYAELILPTIKRFIKEDCNGCKIDHPSQRQHDICLMTPFSVFMRMNLHRALDLITPHEVHRLTLNRACLYKAVEIPLSVSVWQDKWTRLCEARLLVMHYSFYNY